MKLTRKSHSAILAGYLYRLTLAELREILAAAEAKAQAQLNHGLGAQLRANQRMAEVIVAATDTMLEHDLELIDGIIEHALHKSQELAK